MEVGYDRWEVVRRRGVKVLVLEDEELFSMLLEDVLTEAGYTVETATNGQEAIERGKALGPDIFFTDWRFTGTTGSVEVAKVLRELKPNLKVILLTGMMGREAADAATAVGAFRLLVKPSSIDDIVAAARDAAAELAQDP
jgi:CheY-like chemotaxis protein